MNSKIVSAVFAASLAFSSVAFAGTVLPSYEMGTIKAIDPVAMTVTMSNGVVYYFPATVNLSAFKVGESARIGFTVVGDKHDATMIKAN
jgi:hypothetical protein